MRYMMIRLCWSITPTKSEFVGVNNALADTKALHDTRMKQLKVQNGTNCTQGSINVFTIRCIRNQHAVRLPVQKMEADKIRQLFVEVLRTGSQR